MIVIVVDFERGSDVLWLRGYGFRSCSRYCAAVAVFELVVVFRFVQDGSFHSLVSARAGLWVQENH